MQPFFETSGWTLPSAIATPKETKSSKKRNKKKKANQVSVETNPESVTKEADLLQTQIAKLSNSNNNNNSNNSKKKQRNKKRKQAQQEDQASPPSKKAKTSKEPSENNNNKPDTAKQPKPADEPKNDKSKVAAKTKPVGKKEKQELRQVSQVNKRGTKGERNCVSKQLTLWCSCLRKEMPKRIMIQRTRQKQRNNSSQVLPSQALLSQALPSQARRTTDWRLCSKRWRINYLERNSGGWMSSCIPQRGMKLSNSSQRNLSFSTKYGYAPQFLLEAHQLTIFI